MTEVDRGKGPQLVSERPEAVENQVLAVFEVKKGDRFIYVFGEGAKSRIRTTSNPYMDAEGTHWIDAEIDVSLQPGETSKLKTTKQRISLADCGVVTYTSGLWNPTNRLLRV